MLEKIREGSQGPAAKIILGAVILSSLIAGQKNLSTKKAFALSFVYFDLHRLLMWAREEGKQTELKLAEFTVALL